MSTSISQRAVGDMLGDRYRIVSVLGEGGFGSVYAADDLPEAHHDDEPLGFWPRMPPLGALPGGTDTPLPVVDLLVPESLLPYWWERITDAGATMAGSWAYDALRVAALRPEIDVDTDDRTIPHEAGWIGGPDQFGAVHLDKGCYRGQETVARVHNLGKPPRRLVLPQSIASRCGFMALHCARRPPAACRVGDKPQPAAALPSAGRALI